MPRMVLEIYLNHTMCALRSLNIWLQNRLRRNVHEQKKTNTMNFIVFLAYLYTRSKTKLDFDKFLGGSD